MGYTADPRVDAYIAALPPWQQAICQEVRELVHAADPEVTETIKRTVQPYFVLQGNVCALLAAKKHVNVFLYDGAIVPDPDHIITGGHDNSTARTVAVREGETVPAAALLAMFREIVAHNRAGGWRAVKRTASTSTSPDRTGPQPPAERPSLYEFAGGDAAFVALATAHHARCLQDPELSHPFSHPDQHPQHVERLAAYWAEVRAVRRGTPGRAPTTRPCCSCTRATERWAISANGSWPAASRRPTTPAFPPTLSSAPRCGPTWSGRSTRCWPVHRWTRRSSGGCRCRDGRGTGSEGGSTTMPPGQDEPRVP